MITPLSGNNLIHIAVISAPVDSEWWLYSQTASLLAIPHGSPAEITQRPVYWLPVMSQSVQRCPMRGRERRDKTSRQNSSPMTYRWAQRWHTTLLLILHPFIKSVPLLLPCHPNPTTPSCDIPVRIMTGVSEHCSVVMDGPGLPLNNSTEGEFCRDSQAAQTQTGHDLSIVKNCI